VGLLLHYLLSHVVPKPVKAKTLRRQ